MQSILTVVRIKRARNKTKTFKKNIINYPVKRYLRKLLDLPTRKLSLNKLALIILKSHEQRDKKVKNKSPLPNNYSLMKIHLMKNSKKE